MEDPSDGSGYDTGNIGKREPTSVDTRAWDSANARLFASSVLILNPFGTIGLTTSIFFLLNSPVLVALFYMGQPP